MTSHPFASHHAGHADPWETLSRADTAHALCSAWLAVLCERLVSTRAGLLLMRQEDDTFAPVAAHPEQSDLSYLRSIATESLRSREATVNREQPGSLQIAYPLLVNDLVEGCVVLDLGAANDRDMAHALHLVTWGTGWIAGLLHQRELDASRTRIRRGGVLLDTLLGLMAQRTPQEAAVALVNRLGREFDCQLVQLAMKKGGSLRLTALSHAAWFDERSNLLTLAMQAMHEASDQGRTIAVPAQGVDQAKQVALAAERYCRDADCRGLAIVPLRVDGRVEGVLLLERSEPFEAEALDFLDDLAQGLAPALMLQRDAAQGPVGRVSRSLRSAWAGAVGPRYPAVKLGLALGGLALAGISLWPVSFRISSQALVEGSVQRAAVVPFEGFLREAPARAGDVVKSGQVLAVLDDRDLKLERVRWESELEVALRKEREAMASGKAVDQRLAAAQANQARAQLDLVISRLQRARITAPFDATVVKGDLTQQLGTPVELGKVLFELAPLDSWRVILKVDERDIGYVRVGAPGELVLASLPGRSWPFTVTRLMPVSIPEDGRNHFRVEAQLAEGAPRLSPNMEGVGKIQAGRESLLWIWTRPLMDWCRLTWWRLTP